MSLERVVEVAKTWVNREFRPGQGEQCANFVRHVFQQANVFVGEAAHPTDEGLLRPEDGGLGRGFADSFSGDDVGVRVSRPDLTAGDLVLFRNTYGSFNQGVITHVGIYIGNGQVIHRPTKNMPVQQDSLSHWGNLFVEGRRVGAVNLAQPPAAPARIQALVCLDAGHGGSDSGAVGPGGTREKDVTLKVTLKLKELLQAKGMRVVMTRTTDVDVIGPDASPYEELSGRAEVANRNLANIFVSIHCNSFTTANAHGTETHCFPGSREGRRLASGIQNQLVAFVGSAENRGVKETDFAVLRYTDMPAVLVELFFLSNPEQEEALKSEATQGKFADAIAAGVVTYFRG